MKAIIYGIEYALPYSMKHWTAEARTKQSEHIQNWKLWDKLTAERQPS
jgi:hypothetical protein